MVPNSIDVDSMAAACKPLLGTHDFSSFASTRDPVQSFIRTVIEARIQDTGYRMQDAGCGILISAAGQRLICFHIEANGFLRCMVRAIVGTLLEIGKGKMPPEKMLEILEARDRSVAGPSLPAKGLCLVKVGYGL